MAAHDGYTRLEMRLGQALAGFQIVQGMLEYPRVVKSAPADAHSCAPGLLEHLFGSLRAGNVAIANYGYFFDRVDHGPDPGQVYRARKPLFSCAAMNEKGRYTSTFERARKLGCGNILLVPSQTHFSRDRDLDGIDHAANQRRGFGEFAHHGRATSDATNLPHWATHVNID